MSRVCDSQPRVKGQIYELGGILRMMKRIAALFSLLVLICALPLVAKAFEQSLLPLSNQNLITLLQNSNYKDWDFYQPSERETDDNTSSGDFLDRLNTYPIVACHDDDVCLITLKKVNFQWQVSTTNEQALVREGFMLKCFSIDESDDIQYVYFDFEDEDQNPLTLCLLLSNIYPSYFSFVQTPKTQIVFHYDRGMTFQFDFPFLFRCSYELNPERYTPFAVDAFSFAECPIAMQEFFVRSSVSPQEEVAGLYAFPDDSMEPVLKLSEGESIDVLVQQQIADWTLAYYKGNLFFIHTDDIFRNND